MEEALSFEMLVNFYQTTRHHVLEESNIITSIKISNLKITEGIFDVILTVHRR